MTRRRLLTCAAVMHVTLAVVLLVAGRTRIAPALIDSDGIVARAAPDSYPYQRVAILLAGALRHGDVAAWARNPAPLHTRAIAICFAAFAPLAGDSPLAAEPFNLLCYLAIVALVFAIGREAGGDRAATIAAALVAVWPTFLFHTLQLLKDPLFIASALALVYLVLTWLTNTYDWRRAATASVMLLGASGLVLLVRPQFVFLVVAVTAAALALLAVRQIVERRLILPNLACAAITLAIVGLAALAQARPAPPLEAIKQFPSPDAGEPKSGIAALVPTSISRSAPRRGRWEAADRASLALGSLRSRFAFTSAGTGSAIDDGVVFLSARDVAAYLPRAAAIGLWAPFPDSWLASGQSVGAPGRALAGIETLAIYLCEGLAIAAVLLPPRRAAASLLFLFAAFGITGEALVVANLGALYRFRFAFWLLLIALGAIGFSKLRPKSGAAAAVLLAMFSVSCAGARPGPPPGTMRVANITGFRVQGIYLSPRDARTWQENLLGGGVLEDGRTIDILFPPPAAAIRWDVRVDGVDGYRGEWNGLDLSAVSALTLRIAHGALVADLEDERIGASLSTPSPAAAPPSRPAAPR